MLFISGSFDLITRITLGLCLVNTNLHGNKNAGDSCVWIQQTWA